MISEQMADLLALLVVLGIWIAVIRGTVTINRPKDK